MNILPACIYECIYVCMSVCVCVCMWTTCMLVPWGQGEGVRSSGPRVTYGFELPWGCWEPNLGLCKGNKCSSMLSRLQCPGRCACVGSQLSQTHVIHINQANLTIAHSLSISFLSSLAHTTQTSQACHPSIWHQENIPIHIFRGPNLSRISESNNTLNSAPKW